MEVTLRYTIEELVDIETLSDVQLSPTGKQAAYVLGQSCLPGQGKPARRFIYLVDLESRQSRRFAGQDASANESPCWSPDGERLAFVSNRADPDEMQLYVIGVSGGEAERLTDLRGSVECPRWLGDGSAIGGWIAFLYNGTLDKEKRPDPDPVVMDAEPRFNRVWLVNVETHELKAVTPETCHVFEYAASADGSKLVALAGSHPNPAEGWYSAQLHAVELASGQMMQLCIMPHQIGRLTWSPDGKAVAFVSGIMSDEGNISGEVYVVSAEGGQARCLTPGIDQSITWIDWHQDGILYGGRHIDSAVFGCMDPQSGASRLISKGVYSINGWGAQHVSVARNRTRAALRESFSEPPNVSAGALYDADWRSLTDSAVDPEKFPPLRVENRHWQHPDGTPVHGFLVYPPDYQPGKRYPLIAHVHGGPSWSYTPRYVSPWERLLTGRGCLVLMPNPRGSWGRGHAYQSANVGDLGGGDWQDINAGVDALIAEGLADPEQLGICGWSYGGYLVTWAVTQTDRFRCAIAGASITSYESNYGVVNNREWQTTMFGSNVYDDYELHRSRSPIAYASRVKTPTLLVHGQSDTVAPPQQSIEFYIALKHFGVPTQLVLYPREPHGFRERAHQIDLYQRLVGWVDKYLLEVQVAETTGPPIV